MKRNGLKENVFNVSFTGKETDDPCLLTLIAAFII